MGPWLKLAIYTVSGGLAIQQMAGDTRLQCQGLEYLTDSVTEVMEGFWCDTVEDSSILGGSLGRKNFWELDACSPSTPTPFFFFFFLKLLWASVSWVTAAFINYDMQNVLQEIVLPLFLNIVNLAWRVLGKNKFLRAGCMLPTPPLFFR